MDIQNYPERYALLTALSPSLCLRFGSCVELSCLDLGLMDLLSISFRAQKSMPSLTRSLSFSANSGNSCLFEMAVEMLR